MEEAQERIEALTEAVMLINADLGSRVRSDGESAEDYKAWRMRAMHANSFIVRELKFLKRWILNKRNLYNGKAINVDYDDPKSLVHASCAILGSMKNQGVEFTDEENTLLNLLRDYLQHK